MTLGERDQASMGLPTRVGSKLGEDLAFMPAGVASMGLPTRVGSKPRRARELIGTLGTASMGLPTRVGSKKTFERLSI